MKGWLIEEMRIAMGMASCGRRRESGHGETNGDKVASGSALKTRRRRAAMRECERYARSQALVLMTITQARVGEYQQRGATVQ